MGLQAHIPHYQNRPAYVDVNISRCMGELYLNQKNH